MLLFIITSFLFDVFALIEFLTGEKNIYIDDPAQAWMQNRPRHDMNDTVVQL